MKFPAEFTHVSDAQRQHWRTRNLKAPQLAKREGRITDVVTGEPLEYAARERPHQRQHRVRRSHVD